MIEDDFRITKKRIRKTVPNVHLAILKHCVENGKKVTYVAPKPKEKVKFDS